MKQINVDQQMNHAAAAAAELFLQSSTFSFSFMSRVFLSYWADLKVSERDDLGS